MPHANIHLIAPVKYMRRVLLQEQPARGPISTKLCVQCLVTALAPPSPSPSNDDCACIICQHYLICYLPGHPYQSHL